MLNLRLLVTGAAVAAGIHYITKKRPDGSSIFEDLKAQAPGWMNQARPYLDQLKGQFSKVPHIKGGSAEGLSYPQKFDKISPEPDSDYSS
jgi:hypothetical protein